MSIGFTSSDKSIHDFTPGLQLTKQLIISRCGGRDDSKDYGQCP